MKKIYFAGSIRGGRGDVALYAQLIALLRQKAVVLTEFVGDRTLEDVEQATMTDADLYTRDMALEEQCDLVVAECTTPSLGVGYEVSHAENLGKPVYLLYRPSGDHRLSAMLSGNPYFHCVPYETPQEVIAALEPVLLD